MKMIRSIISITIIIFFVFGCQPKSQPGLKTQKNNNTLLWQISGKDLKKPSYIFGTFHLLCKDDINISEQLKSALASSEKIYMELDLDDPTTMLSAMLYMNMKDKKLKDLYTEAEYKRIENYFTDTLHTPLMMFQKMKPYFLVAFLYPKMMSCKNASGVEEELIKLAKQNKKEVLGLETMQFQASIFDSIPYEWQAKELLKNIDSFETNKKQFDVLINDYKNQRLSNMEKLLAKSEFGSEKYEEILLTKRNINWVEQLKNIMPRENVFVAVGAGHLTGKNGLLSLLKKEGYTVEPLLNK